MSVHTFCWNVHDLTATSYITTDINVLCLFWTACNVRNGVHSTSIYQYKEVSWPCKLSLIFYPL